jgi:tRNA(Ile)-lysidine synthase
MRAALTVNASPTPPSDWLADFDARLAPDAPWPIAVAFSGGGDSLAALLAAKAWADRAGRRVIALTVDHGLNAQSPAWTAFATDKARLIGADFQALAWTGDKPAAGLPAAARAARHRLLAEAARAAGAKVIVFGHTADDIAEAALMRAEGSSVGAPRVWSPSPAWPAGRGVFILRPLLKARRAAIRETLHRLGEARWLEDPSNTDPRFARARARARLVCAEPVPVRPDDTAAADLARRAVIDEAGWLTIDRAALAGASPAARRRWIGAALLSVGGGARPPRGTRLSALIGRLAGAEAVTATLAGAKLVAGPAEVLIVRDAGEVRRGGMAALPLGGGQTGVWDGRFEITAGDAPIMIAPLAGHGRRMADAARARLKALPDQARGALPSYDDANGARICPILAQDGGVKVRSLVAERLFAACGVFLKEPAA